MALRLGKKTNRGETAAVCRATSRPLSLANLSAYPRTREAAPGDPLARLASPNFTFDSTGFSLAVTGPEATGAIPEPATWAMMLLGFGGLGSVLRRRRSRVVFAA